MQSQTGKNDRPPTLSCDLNAGYVIASLDAGSQRGERMATAAQRLDAAMADLDDALSDFPRPIQSELADAPVREDERALGLGAAR